MKPIAKRSKGLRVLAAVGGLAIAAGLAVIGGVIAATIQRLHEISGGEEEDAKRY